MKEVKNLNKINLKNGEIYIESGFCPKVNVKPERIKLCKKCNGHYSLDKFRDIKSTNGKIYKSSLCKDCSQEYNKNWQKNNENKVLEYRKKYLKSKPHACRDSKRKMVEECRNNPNGLISGQRWSGEEEEFVKDNYHKIPYKKMALILNRTYDAINKRVRVLGITK